MDVDINSRKLSPGEVLARGWDWGVYDAAFESAISKAYIEREHAKQRAEEAARRELLAENFKARRSEELNWNPVQPGITTTCIACGAEVHIFGTYRDGFDDTDPREPHLFKESVEGRAILTARCSRCNKSIAVNLGRLAPSAPSNFPSLSAVEKIGAS